MAKVPTSKQPYRVTTARGSNVDDQNSRMLRYLVMMAIRMACFGLLFVTPDPWRFLWIGGAVVLPYIAVLVANQVGEPHPGALPIVHPEPTLLAITAPPEPDGTAEVVIIPGEVIDPEPIATVATHTNSEREGRV